MSTHLVRSFEEALRGVHRDVLAMGQLTRDQLAAATRLLSDEGLATDAQDAASIEATDDDVDDFDEKIEREVQHILALRQPMADDLRSLLSCDRIATDLERIADHAKNIAHRAERVRESGVSVDLSRTRTLADAVLEQLDAVLTAVTNRDEGAARAIWRQDEAIDRLFDDTFNNQLETMCQTPSTAAGCTNALFIAKALERIGDHVTNIAEDLVYWLTAERMRKRSAAAADEA